MTRYRVTRKLVYEVGEDDGTFEGLLAPNTPGDAINLVAEWRDEHPLVDEKYTEWGVEILPP